MSLNDPTVCDVDVPCVGGCGDLVRIHDWQDLDVAVCDGCEAAAAVEDLDRADGLDVPELHAARQQLTEAAL